MSGHQVLKMPPLRDLPMPWRLGESEQKKFWWVQDVAMGRDLGVGCPLPEVQLEEAGWRIPWMLAIEPAEKGSPLVPLGPGPMEVDGAKQVPGDGATAGETTDSEETDPSLAHDSQP